MAAWAHENHVPRSTAYRWAGQPEVRAAAESSRRCACNRVLGRLARRAYRESCQLAKLAECAESESVRLRALRSIYWSFVIGHSSFVGCPVKAPVAVTNLMTNARRSTVYTRLKTPKKAPLCLIMPRAQNAIHESVRCPHPISSQAHPVRSTRFRRFQSRAAQRVPRAPDPFGCCSLLPEGRMRSSHRNSISNTTRHVQPAAPSSSCPLRSSVQSRPRPSRSATTHHSSLTTHHSPIPRAPPAQPAPCTTHHSPHRIRLDQFGPTGDTPPTRNSTPETDSWDRAASHPLESRKTSQAAL